MQPNMLLPTPNEQKDLDMKNVLSKLVDLQMSQSVPEIDIDVFSGNPLDFGYFRATFQDVIEKKISDPRGRLTRLLKYTNGEAKKLIQYCIYEKESECFDKSIQY